MEWRPFADGCATVRSLARLASMHLHPSWAFKTIPDLNARIIKEPEVLLENIGLPLLQMAYRGQVQLTPQQMRAAIEALPFEVPKLGGSFAERLERAWNAAHSQGCYSRLRLSTNPWSQRTT